MPRAQRDSHASATPSLTTPDATDGPTTAVKTPSPMPRPPPGSHATPSSDARQGPTPHRPHLHRPLRLLEVLNGRSSVPIAPADEVTGISTTPRADAPPEFVSSPSNTSHANPPGPVKTDSAPTNASGPPTRPHPASLFWATLALRTARKSRAVELLAHGLCIREVADCLQVSPAAVRQGRLWLARSWRRSQGELTPID